MEVVGANTSAILLLLSRFSTPFDVEEFLPFVKRGHSRGSDSIFTFSVCSEFQDRLIHVLSAIVQFNLTFRILQCNVEFFLCFVLIYDL